ncbi:MAG: acyl-[acyl-carrier-protein] thioesterase [Catonella sp.]|uniref:acyl-[acyl-carrier-protein] thioesterase n=1 Tax=Catonella sp. TaxID=2382125 RepID=UPI003F9FB6CD
MYKFKSRVRFSETAKDNKLAIPHLISYFQDCSNFHSNSIGLYKDKLLGMERAWFLSSWQIVINRRPDIDEEIEVETRAYEIKGVYGFRNFIMYGADKEVCAYANSIWFYVDTEKGKPVKYEKEGIGFEIDEEFPMEKADRKIVIPSDLEKIIKADCLKVRESHLDSNCHMNNREYVRIALDFLPESLELDRIRQIRVEYKKAAVLNETMIPAYYFDEGNNRIFVSLDNEVGENFAKVEFELG